MANKQLKGGHKKLGSVGLSETHVILYLALYQNYILHLEFSQCEFMYKRLIKNSSLTKFSARFSHGTHPINHKQMATDETINN